MSALVLVSGRVAAVARKVSVWFAREGELVSALLRVAEPSGWSSFGYWIALVFESAFAFVEQELGWVSA